MKREIKFRGKRIDNGDWVYGLFTNKEIGSLIVPVIEVYHEWDSGDYMESHEVDGDTLGEYTGLRDKNGREIYEGDIVKRYHLTGTVVYDTKRAMFIMMDGFNESLSNEIYGVEVIGNIYENPELIK